MAATVDSRTNEFRKVELSAGIRTSDGDGVTDTGAGHGLRLCRWPVVLRGVRDQSLLRMIGDPQHDM